MSNLTQNLFSGALSGFASTMCLQPFDLLKTRKQQGDGMSQTRNTNLILRTSREIVARDGLKGLWRGTAPSLLRNVPGAALYMTSLTQLRTLMATLPYFSNAHKRPAAQGKHSSVLPKLTIEGNLLAGATARVGVGFLLNPFSVLKARFESNMYAYESLTSSFFSIVRSGPSEVLRGFFAASLRDAPSAGLFVVFYEAIKRETSQLLPPTSTVYSTCIHSFSAASAGAISTMVTQPFDVIKTKIQVRTEDRYRGFTRTVQTIWSQRGISGFFDGASLRISRKIFSSAIGWAAFEGILMFMRTSEAQRTH
jgi:solute carrier family 25 protein 38